MDIVTYALCKKLAASAVSGISNITQSEDGKMIITTNDGNTFELTLPSGKGEDGISIVEVKVDENNHLICTLSDGSIVDAGEIIGGSVSADYASKEDIDKIFSSHSSTLDGDPFAKEEDIDNIFKA